MKIIYLDIDSLRFDHLGCYGYQRPTSPNLDRLAAGGVKFTQCFTSDSPCMPSRAATISGMFGVKNGIVTHGERGMQMKQDAPTLPEVLRENGVHSAAFSTFGRHPSPWFYGGWGDYHDPVGWTFQQTPAWKMNELVLPWMDQHANDDFFLYVQYWDPHAIYAAPQGCIDAIKDGPLPAYPTPEQIAAQQSDDWWHSARMMGIHNYEDYVKVVNEYDAEIRYVDFYVGQLLKRLDALGIAEDTMIIVAADHGEGLGEHGVYVEHWSTMNTTNQIPLLVRYPKGVKGGQTCTRLVYQFDIAATVLDAFGVETPEAWDSQSLWPLLQDSQAAARDYLVIGHGLYTAQRAVVTPDWKMIRTLHGGEWKYPAVQLFNKHNDPFEQHDVAAQHPDVINELSGLLCEWEYTHLPSDGIDPTLLNAHAQPPGLDLYGREAIDRFREQGAPQPVVLGERKPEVPLVDW